MTDITQLPNWNILNDQQKSAYLNQQSQLNQNEYNRTINFQQQANNLFNNMTQLQQNIALTAGRQYNNASGFLAQQMSIINQKAANTMVQQIQSNDLQNFQQNLAQQSLVNNINSVIKNSSQ